MRTHKDLVVWQNSIQFVKEIYFITRNFPQEEKFGLCSQMQRAAVSIPSNIAEGYGRGSNNELLRFLSFSSGSASELETQLILCESIGYIDKETFCRLEQEIVYIRKMLSSLISKVRQRDKDEEISLTN